MLKKHSKATKKDKKKDFPHRLSCHHKMGYIKATSLLSVDPHHFPQKQRMVAAFYVKWREPSVAWCRFYSVNFLSFRDFSIRKLNRVFCIFMAIFVHLSSNLSNLFACSVLSLSPGPGVFIGSGSI